MKANTQEELAKAMGVSHRLVTFTEKDFRELLPIVAKQLDEPLGDPAALPTSRLCKAAKNHVKVILSGEGADELFGGYEYYRAFGKKQKLVSATPRRQNYFTKLETARPTNSHNSIWIPPCMRKS